MTDDLLPENNELDYHDELVGEGKKFKTDSDLAKGKYIADKYIATLESQLDQLREDYIALREENVANESLRDLVKQARKPQAKQEDITPVETKPTIDPRQIESLIDERISEREQARRKNDNVALVRSKLEAALGKDYQDKLQQKITDLDLSMQDVNNMARNNPKMLFKLLEVDKPTDAPTQDVFRSLPRSSMTSANFKPMTEERTWAYYQKMKQTDPKKYYSAETNVQMHKDALSLGERFEDGDFNAYAKDYRISF